MPCCESAAFAAWKRLPHSGMPQHIAVLGCLELAWELLGVPPSAWIPPTAGSSDHGPRINAGDRGFHRPRPPAAACPDAAAFSFRFNVLGVRLQRARAAWSLRHQPSPATGADPATGGDPASGRMTSIQSMLHQKNFRCEGFSSSTP